MDGYAGGSSLDASGVDTALPDTSAPDTAIADGGKDSGTDTRADTLVADTLVADTFVADTFVADTFVADTFVADTFVADTSVTDTFVADTADTSVTDAPVGCHLVINEVQTRGTSGYDEFVEIYNPCDVDVPITGWKLAYRPSAGGTSDTNLVTFPAGAKVVAKGFVLAVNVSGLFAGEASPVVADFTFTSGVADDGSVGLRDNTGALVDSVGWGTAAATNPFVETAAALGPASGASISRVPAGKDTNNNSADFVKTTPSTPKS